LEAEINRLATQLAEERSESSRKITRAESQFRNAQLKAEQLAKQLERVQKDDDNARDALRKKEIEFLQQKHELESQVRALDKKLAASRDDLVTERESAHTTIKEFERSKEELRAQCKILAQQNTTLEEEVQSMKEGGLPSFANSPTNDILSVTESLELQTLVKRLQREKNALELQVESLENSNVNTKAYETVKRELLEKEKRVRRLEAELQKSDESQFSILEKNEKIKELEGEVTRLRERTNEILSAEAERDALLAERRDWDLHFMKIQNEFTSLRENDENSFPNKLRHQSGSGVQQALKMLKDLQNECVFLTKSKGTAELRLKKLERESDQSKSQLLSAKSELAKMAVLHSKLEDSSKAAEKKCVFLEEQVKMLSRVIEATGKEASLSDGSDNDTEQSKALAIQNEGLKSQLAQAQSRIRDLESDGSTYREACASPAVARVSKNRIVELEQQLVKAEKDNQTLAKVLDKAKDKISELEHSVASGAYNPSKTKILHMTMNPARNLKHEREKNRSAEVDRLKKMNAELTEKINSLLAGKENPSAISPTLNLAPSQAQQDIGKRHERLKALFKQKTKAFREAVYLLTGFMIDMTQDQNPQLRVRSMFAERENDHLVFQWQPDVEGGLHLLETEFCSRIDEHIFSYLKKCNSVPAFLSVLTLDLFEKQTFLLPS